MIIHKPSLESCEVPHKIWANRFSRSLDTNKQTNTQAMYKDSVGVVSNKRQKCRTGWAKYFCWTSHDPMRYLIADQN